jgi:hypothetical protein
MATVCALGVISLRRHARGRRRVSNQWLWAPSIDAALQAMAEDRQALGSGH